MVSRELARDGDRDDLKSGLDRLTARNRGYKKRLASSRLVDQRNAADHIADVLREAICTGVLDDGEELNQADLAAQFGVSRIPMREALRILQCEALIEVRPHHKALVASLTPSALGEIYEMRELIELHLLELVDDRIDDSVVTSLADLCERMEDGIEEDEWLALTRDYHDTLLSPARRPLLLDAMSRYRRLGQRYQFLAVTERRTRRLQANKEHRKILAAIQHGDRQLARECLQEHIRSAGTGLLRALATREDRPETPDERTGVSANP